MKKIFIVLFVLLLATPCVADIGFLPWSTTFNCTEFTQTGAECSANQDDPNCDSITNVHACSSLNHGISAAANYASGGGGNGYFWQVGDGDTTATTGPTGSNLSLALDTAPTHLWIRFYFRHPTGMPIDGAVGFSSHKLMYVYGPGNSFYVDDAGGGFRFYNRVALGHTSTTDFTDFYGGNFGDNTWHAVEFEFYINGASSEFRIWAYPAGVDNATPVYAVTGTTYPIASMTEIAFPSNVKTDFTGDANGQTYDVHYDDIAISTTGRIGPLGTTDANAPAIGTPSPSGALTCTASGGVTTTVSAVVTDATPTIDCKCSTSSGFDFDTQGDAMTPDDGGSGATFSVQYADSCSTSYTRYIKCRDSAASPNTTSTANATVVSYSYGAYATDSTAPVLGTVTPEGLQACIYNPRDVTVTVANVTDATAPIACKVSATSDFNYATEGSLMTPSGTGLSGESHSYTFTGGEQMACGSSYVRYVKCQDSAASPNTSAQSTASFSIAAQGTANLLFYESFDDQSFASRSWFDGTPTSASLDTTTKQSGAGSAKWTWASTATSPTGWATIRRTFTPSESLYIRFYWRFDNAWVGSGLSYQPHLVYILSEADNAAGGLSWNYGELYVEVNYLNPHIEYQDGRNVNTSQTLPYDFANAGANQTETRSVNHCNGLLTGQDPGDDLDCFLLSGSDYYSSRYWYGSSNMIKNSWELVEVYASINSLVDSKAVADGVLQMRINGVQVINKTNIIYRTNTFSDFKFDTLVLAPYIGAGSPVNGNTMWMDELYVYDSQLSAPTVSSAGGSGGWR